MKVLVLADVSNLYYTISNHLNGRLDYAHFLEKIRNLNQWLIPSHHEIVLWRAIAYGSNSSEDKHLSFERLLSNLGWEPKFKQAKTYSNIVNGQVKQNKKSDWDVGMAMDIAAMLDNVDIVVLATGDGDMVPCVQYIRSKGKIAIAIGCNMSRDLRESVNYWCELDSSWLTRYFPKDSNESNKTEASLELHDGEPINGVDAKVKS